MNNERGYWELASPLPDLPTGTVAEHSHAGWYIFYVQNRGCSQGYSSEVMRRNPAIFRWVPEPKRMEWPSPDRVDVTQGFKDVAVCASLSPERKIMLRDAIRAVLQALREGKAIVAVWKTPYENQQVLIRPDGGKP